MKIKKLSILGFKSIMDRLELNFSGGISGIVGPNGCGKSNIVDAIRWVLGEQSAKQLRGREMQDVIFSGAGEFKQLGMAEVTIVFENGDGSFPPAFSQQEELSVTRRLYRSGESEYLINSVPCRLKDIQEIFMDTGLGNKAYSVIGQGKIGSILEQKPEETRAMLEEAAGITKYRKKVEEAHKKIALTEQNLQRVEDLIGEVQRQMNVMKRQAAKAKRFKALSEEIRRLELILSSNSYAQLKALAGEKDRSTERLSAREAELTALLAGSQARILTLQQQSEEKEGLVVQARDALLNLKDRLNKKEAEAASLIKEIEVQQQLEDRLLKEREGLKTRARDLEAEKASLVERSRALKEKASAMEEELALKEMRISSKRRMLQETRETFEKTREALNAEINKETGLTHESGYLLRLLNQASDSRSRLMKELQEIEAKIKALSAASERKTSAREAAAERLEDLEGRMEEEKAAKAEIEQVKKRIEGELKGVEAELQTRKARLGSLRSMAENFEGLGLGVRSVMKSKDLEPNLQEVAGLVADFMRIDPGYERALEAALGDKLQWIVVTSRKGAMDGVSFLREKSKGKAGFVPLEEALGRADEQSCSGLPPLRDIVAMEGSHAKAVGAILQGVFLAPDLRTAVEAWEKDGGKYSYVTPEGDLVEASGAIVGGRLSSPSFSILARRREMEALLGEITGLEKRTDDIRASLEAAQDRLDQCSGAMEELSEQRWKAQDELNEIDKTLVRIGQEWDQQERLASKIRSELAQKDKEEGKGKEALDRLKEQLKEVQDRRSRHEVLMKEKESALKEAEAEYEILREELSKAKAAQGGLREEQRGLLKEAEGVERLINESLKRASVLDDEVELCRGRLLRCRMESEEIRKQLEGAFERLRKAEEGLRQAEKEKQEVLAAVRQREAEAEGVRADLQTVREEINTVRMANAEIAFKLKSLRESVRERWNLALEDIYGQYLADDFSQRDVEEQLAGTKELKDRLGDVNLMAIKEHAALEERYQFMVSQKEDLIKSIESLRLAIRKINQTSLEKFTETFKEVDRKLKEVFPLLFSGGTAGLALTDESAPLESGVLVQVQLPGKRLSHMGLLSGGEKALVAMALLFAIYMIKPSPFCLLDEVDAPLDEANVDRFNNLLKEIKRTSQIIMVTHKRKTMEITDRLYGITMEKTGISKVVSVDIKASAN